MPNSRRKPDRAERPCLRDSEIVRIADELERRMRNVLRPEPIPTAATSPTRIDPDDLMTPQKAASLYGVSDQTVYRRMAAYDISECIAGTVLISRRKVDAHLARPGGHRAF